MKMISILALSLAMACTQSKTMHYDAVSTQQQYEAKEKAKAVIVAAARTYHTTYHRLESRRQEILETDKDNGQIHYFEQEKEKAKKAFFEKIEIPHNSPQLINAPYYDYNPAQQSPEQWYAQLLGHPRDLKDIAKSLGLEKKYLKELPTNNCTII